MQMNAVPLYQSPLMPSFGRRTIGNEQGMKALLQRPENQSLFKTALIPLSLAPLAGIGLAISAKSLQPVNSTLNSLHKPLVSPTQVGLSNYIGHVAAGIIAIPLAYFGIKKSPAMAAKGINLVNQVWDDAIRTASQRRGRDQALRTQSWISGAWNATPNWIKYPGGVGAASVAGYSHWNTIKPIYDWVSSHGSTILNLMRGQAGT
jgi:hypothetical protein